jgi:beta-galactosidase
MKERPFLWGKFVWNMFDFAVDGRDEGDAKGRNDKGLVTYDRRTKKDSFYWFKANWSDEPVVYITGRRFNPRQNITTTVKVYANMDSVLLELNGISLGTMVGPERIFSWPNVALKPGSNRVRAVGRKGSGTWIDQAVWVLQ